MTELRQFLRLISHYSASIASLHLYKERFGKLCEKYSHFEWTLQTQSDFECVKSAICSSVKLFNSTSLTRLSTNSSSFAVGGVLQQYDKDKKCWQAVWHFSKSLNQAQRNWNQSEKKCYSIISGLRKFKYFLLGRHFEIHTNHQALLSLINHKDGIPVSTSGRLQRWIYEMQHFNFLLSFRNTSVFREADTLSRLCSVSSASGEDEIIIAESLCS